MGRSTLPKLRRRGQASKKATKESPLAGGTARRSFSPRLLPLLAWFLWYGDWRPIEQANNESMCLQMRSQAVTNAANGEIGSALADQPADNPMRQEAYRRAERKANDLYRCAWRPD
jgi:hypothetical protein